MEQFANCIAVFFILQFCWSYYWNCYRRGYTMDLWHFTLFNLVVVIHVMLPFSRSDLNVFALGGLLRGMQAHVTQAYLISALGYLAVLVGGNLWRVHLGVGLRQLFSELVELPAQGALFLLQSRTLLIAHGVVAFGLSVGILLYYFKAQGFGFNLGAFIIQQPSLRPIAQFIAFYSILVGSYCIARYYALRERSMLIIFLLIILTQLFFGGRSNLANIVLMTVLVALLRSGRRISPVVFGMGVASALAVAALLDGLRQPVFSLQRIIANFALTVFYGNSFSDTRDFAVVLSFWDGRHFYGLTYLAALFAFIPRYLSTFRDTWSIGVITAGLAGFKPTEHAGLRVGIFGEAFLNFGIVGVVFLGALVGAVAKLIDLRTKAAVTSLPRSSLVPFSYFIIFSVLGAAEVSSAASSMYTMFLIFTLSWIFVQIARGLKIAI